MNHRAMGSTGRRTFIGAAFAGLGITGLNARPQKPQVGATPMREFGKTGVKLTVVGQGGARLALLRTKDAARAHVRQIPVGVMREGGWCSLLRAACGLGAHGNPSPPFCAGAL